MEETKFDEEKCEEKNEIVEKMNKIKLSNEESFIHFQAYDTSISKILYISSTNEIISSARGSEKIKFWSFKNNFKAPVNLKTHGSPVVYLEEFQKSFASLGFDETLKIWDLKKKKFYHSFNTSKSNQTYPMYFLFNTSNLFIYGGRDNLKISIWNLFKSKQKTLIQKYIIKENCIL